MQRLHSHPQSKPVDFSACFCLFNLIDKVLGGNNAPRFVKDANQSLVETNAPWFCLLYTSPSPRDQRGSRMPSSA